ncbi:hypothetical protein [Flexivirga alba]|uniref:Winged helix DNA-binding domain-containing protein n=1 Tax=Flexivirga alba TaxID=702742 RepID=A0ABW2AN17_9MICO
MRRYAGQSRLWITLEARAADPAGFRDDRRTVSNAEPLPDNSDDVAAARLEHVELCAANVQRLRGQLVSAPIGRLRLIDASDDADLPWNRLRQGSFVTCDPSALEHEERLILTALAMEAVAQEPRIYAHDTARAVWRLAAIGQQNELVEFARPPRGTGRSPQARRRRTAFAPKVVDIGGLRVTDLDRTVIDRARYASLESAIAMCDEALRLTLLEQPEVLAQVRELPRRARGCRMAELTLLLADARSESPLESLSRVRMFQLGLPMPELQVKFYDASGFIGRVDFFWPELGIIGEADGRLKFRVADGLRGDEAEEAVWRAKRRDDRLLRHPDVRKVGHWDWGEALNAYQFVQVMADLGVRPVPDGGWPIPEGPLPRKSRHLSVIERHTR